MLAITKKEWRSQLKYKYDNRDSTPIKPVAKEEVEISEQTPTEGVTASDQPPQEEGKKSSKLP